LEDEDKFIILASDGIWEVISNKEAINIVANSWLKKHSSQKA
jgi:serine/threonine protein phosphatase PrpC